jgi:peptidoglycan/LPS O-acetylase OafA/YrhL
MLDQTIASHSSHSVPMADGAGVDSKPREIFAYRPDLDGLRGLAIILVMLDHYFGSFALFRGQLGVDIFFVISGYLTTSIISTQYINGTFSFASFYARRVKRLFPTLIACFVVTLVVGWFVLDSAMFRLLGGTVAASASGVMNLVLAMGMDFFPTDARVLPFGHLWSLALEEQFYLILPVVVVAIKRNSVFRKMIVPILLILSILSWQYWYEHREIFGRTYYNPLARSWELLAGVILALSWGWIQGISMKYSAMVRPWHLSKILVFLLRFIGTMLMVLEMGSNRGLVLAGTACWIGAWFYLKRANDRAGMMNQGVAHGISTDATPSGKPFYRLMTVLGWFFMLSGLSMPHTVPLCVAAILSTIGMVLLITGGTGLSNNAIFPSDQKSSSDETQSPKLKSIPAHQNLQPVHKGWSYAFLSCPIMTYFGRISYALYVIHYPLYTVWIMARGHEVMLDKGLLTFMFLLSLGIGPMVYRYIEEPTRRGPYFWRWVGAMAVCGVLGYMAACGWMTRA